MCGCEYHWDASKSCTCTCTEHEPDRLSRLSFRDPPTSQNWHVRSPELLWLGIALGVVGLVMLGWAVVTR